VFEQHRLGLLLSQLPSSTPPSHAKASRQAALSAQHAVPIDGAKATAAAQGSASDGDTPAPVKWQGAASGSTATIIGADGGESETDEVMTAASDGSLRPQRIRLPSRRGSASVQAHAPLPPRISEETDVDEAIAKMQTLAAEGKVKDIVVLENITLKVARGSLVGVCGAVGAGKSSLISASKYRGTETSCDACACVCVRRMRRYVLSRP
jgi:ABC-type multidrug transport system fused ATPase/permease subunit